MSSEGLVLSVDRFVTIIDTVQSIAERGCMDNTYDFVAWAEDRAALKKFRDDAMNDRLSEALTVARLKADAVKINAACDQLDVITKTLGHTG